MTVHPTKIPQTRSIRVGQLLQVRSGQCCKVPGRMLIPDDGGGPRKTVWTNDIGLITRLGGVRMFSVITTLGVSIEVTFADLAIETFLPADSDSAEARRRLANDRSRWPT